jgi:uncharacterized protein involved in exopolysaccharide biosynthesis
MTNNGQQIREPFYQEDEIDLRELFNVIIKNKTKIITITAIITIAAIIYAVTATKVFEVSSMIQIGKNGSSLLENSSSLVKKLELTNGLLSKNKKEYPYVNKISSIKGTKDLIEISVYGLDNKSAINKLNKIVSDIEQDHQKKLDEYITITKKKLNILIKQKNIIDEEIKQIKSAVSNNNNKNITLASLLLLKDLNAQLSALVENINNIQLSLSSNNIKNTQQVGQVIVSKYPIKPKKKLIVIVAFVTGLILSIFLVFFLEFLKGDSKNKEDS